MTPSLKPLLLALAIVVMVVAPAMAANVTYPQVYYTYGSNSIEHINTAINAGRMYGITYDPIRDTGIANYYELRRQTMLMERQNELLEEQNELMRMQMNKTMKCKVTDYVNMAGSVGSFECGCV